MNNEEIIKVRMTEKGINDFTNKLKTMIRCYNGEEEKLFNYNQNLPLFGFVALNAENETELLGRIKELSEMLGISITQSKITKLTPDGAIQQNKIEIGK